MSDMEWRAGLEPGQHVMIVHHGPMGKRISLATVKKRTATQIVLADDSRWNIATGRKLKDNDSYWHSGLEPFDAVALAYQAKEDQRENLAHQLSQKSWRRESLETLERVMDVLKGGES